MHVIIIGNGIAGNTAAKVIREHGHQVSIITDEPVPLYNACALKLYICDKMTRESIFLKCEQDYGSQGISLYSGSHVHTIDVDHKKVHVEGKELSYDRLIFATGARPLTLKIPGKTLGGIFLFKTLADADRIKARKINRAVIIGSGFIGVEAAVALKNTSAEVTLIELENQILPRAFDKELAARIESRLTENGIRVFSGERVVEFEGINIVCGIRTDKRHIKCDSVVIAAGMQPCTELAARSGIKLGKLGGIATDQYMQVNRDDIFACGDCTESVDLVSGENTLNLTWPNAVLQGKTAGSNCIGFPHKYTGFTNQVGIDIFGMYATSIGHTAREFGNDPVDIIEKEVNNDYFRLILKNGLIVGGQFTGNPKHVGVLFQALTKHIPIRTISKIPTDSGVVLANPLYTLLKRYL